MVEKPKVEKPKVEKKAKAPPLKQAGATQRMSKEELADLLKQAEADDPDAAKPEADNEKPAPQKKK